MAHPQNTIQNRKFTHLSVFERGKIAALHWAGHSNREIGRRIERHHQTIANELKRGTTTQLKTGRKSYNAYFPETGQAAYEQNRENCGAKSKLLVALDFVDYACEMILDHDWSPDAVVGFAKQQPKWKDKPMVSTKTLYNYIDQCLLRVRNIDLAMKTMLNTKNKKKSPARKNIRILGTSIAERPAEVEDREEFGHWEIDTVEGKKSDDNAIKKLQETYGELFPQVFKTITSDNGSEFSNLAACLKDVTDVYFARPYASLRKRFQRTP